MRLMQDTLTEPLIKMQCEVKHEDKKKQSWRPEWEGSTKYVNM